MSAQAVEPGFRVSALSGLFQTGGNRHTAFFVLRIVEGSNGKPYKTLSGVIKKKRLTMSKSIALLLDNSGSMFSPVDGVGTNDKIFETSEGAQLFIANMISTISPGDQFAFSVHRFAQTYELFGAQVDTDDPGFAAALTTMEGTIPGIEDQAASQAAVGNLTDLYDAVRQTADYLLANPPAFGVADGIYILFFGDGIQTVLYGGGNDRLSYEAATGVNFSALLNGNDIRLRAWGIGSNALPAVLRDLTDQAFQPSGATESVLALPGSYTKVLFPVSEGGTFANCTTVIASTATTLVDDNGILPLQPVDGLSLGLLWEECNVPFVTKTSTVPTTGVALQRVNHCDFEVLVDGCTRVLILGLVSHSVGTPSLQATSPGGTIFTPATPGTHTVAVETATLFKIPNPEEGTWLVRVFGDDQQLPMMLNVFARGVFKEFNLGVHAEPFQIFEPGEVVITATPSVAGEPVGHGLRVTAHVFGGASATLEHNDDGSFSGPIEITRPGINPIRVEVTGHLHEDDHHEVKSIHRFEFTECLLGLATDPRFTVNPNTYEQGRSYTVELNLQDARFLRSTQYFSGSGIQTTGFEMLNATVARAHIQVAPDAFVGAREAVTYHPNAESIGAVFVVEAKDRGTITGRICCLRFDAAGNLVGIVLCDGTEICVRLHDDRIQKLLEIARKRNLSVKIYLDSQGCLTGVEICR